MGKNSLLEVKNLKTQFFTEQGKVTAVDGVSFNINKGEIVGVVGESGCGKSVTSQSILQLHDSFSAEYGGEILFNGTDLMKLPKKKMRKVRGKEISMIFQDSLSSLNPVYTVGKQLTEPMLLHQKITKKEAYEQALELLELTHIPAPEKRMNEYPHQLSGGMQQRVMIAMALASKPELLIADEPTTALDVTIQSQILDLLVDLNKKLGMGIVFITHDLGVVAELCNRVLVMYLGQVIEESDVKSLFEQPLHPYTQGLIKSIPKMEGERKTELYTIKGTVPSLNDKPKGCPFVTRCPYADNLCHERNPELRRHNEDRAVRCWHYQEIISKEQDKHADAKN